MSWTPKARPTGARLAAANLRSRNATEKLKVISQNRSRISRVSGPAADFSLQNREKTKAGARPPHSTIVFRGAHGARRAETSARSVELPAIKTRRKTPNNLAEP